MKVGPHFGLEVCHSNSVCFYVPWLESSGLRVRKNVNLWFNNIAAQYFVIKLGYVENTLILIRLKKIIQ